MVLHEEGQMAMQMPNGITKVYCVKLECMLVYSLHYVIMFTYCCIFKLYTVYVFIGLHSGTDNVM